MAAKVTTADLKNLGFSDGSLFNIVDANFDAFLQGIIDLIYPQLEGMLSTATYDSATEPVQSQVKRTELCLCASELVQRRINVKMIATAQGDEKINVKPEMEQREQYNAEAVNLISTLTGDADFSFGGTSTDHFNSDAVEVLQDALYEDADA